jgi:hypothetical protein
VIDELVGLDGELTPLGMQILRERREQEQAEALSKIVPLPPSADEGGAFARLPRREARRRIRARMAAEIVRAMSAIGCVTREDLESAGFTGVEISDHFVAARRAARAERMVI